MPEAQTRTALVTGASSGIGRAIAQRLCTGGWRVLALGRKPDALRSLAKECASEGGAGLIQPLAIDVREPARIAQAVADLGAAPLTALIHAAGVISSRDTFQDMPAEAAEEMLTVNLLAPILLTRALLPAMVAQGRGHVLFIGSSAGRWPHPNAAVYGASKAGLSLFCDALRCDLLGTGVRVTDLAPGRVQTQIYHATLGEAAAREQLYAGYASIQPAEIAELVHTVLTLPAHVDVSRLEVFPTDQAVGGAHIVKTAQAPSQPCPPGA